VATGLNPTPIAHSSMLASVKPASMRRQRRADTATSSAGSTK
jgi:hypothetical protein